MNAPLPPLSVLATQLRRGEIKPTELVHRCLQQIDRLDVMLQAWVVVDRQSALKEAERLERRPPEPQQALWGMPFGVKDIIDVAGLVTGCGSELRATNRAVKNAPIVDRLRMAGAIVLGKTVTTEWACFDPPPTRNPWNFQHTPGGSSSGSAAAVAAEMCLGALGTQTGGSILRPAAYCGVAGFKPGHGVLPMPGIAPVSPSLDHVGPIARSAADLQWIWGALEGDQYLMHDFWIEEEEALIEPPTAIAVVEDEFLAGMSPEMLAGFKKALTALQRTFDLETYALPESMSILHTHHKRIMAAEAAHVHQAEFAANPAGFGPQTAALIEAGAAVTAVDYLTSREHQQRLKSEMLQQWPEGAVLVMPSTMTTAPDLSTTGDPRFNSPWSYLGLPAVTIPSGLDSNGLPMGLQFIGLDEQEVLAAAVAGEKLLGFRHRCPILATNVGG